MNARLSYVRAHLTGEERGIALRRDIDREASLEVEAQSLLEVELLVIESSLSLERARLLEQELLLFEVARQGVDRGLVSAELVPRTERVLPLLLFGPVE